MSQLTWLLFLIFLSEAGARQLCSAAKNMNISSDEYLCIVRVHKYSNDRAADGHLPAVFSWLSVLPLEFCTEQIHNPLITFYLRERHKVHRCINIQMNINGNMRVCEIKPALSLFFDIVQLFTAPHWENVCQKNTMKPIWWETGRVYTCY